MLMVSKDKQTNKHRFNLPSFRSKPVCTRCSKLEGAEMSGFFFFLLNIFAVEEAILVLLLKGHHR